MAKETGMAALAHILGLLTWVVGPLVIYLASDDEFAKENAANALNWQIMFTIYFTVSAVLVIALIGFLLMPLVGLLDLIFCILAAVKASDGEAWEYPLTPNIV
jgi:uncharacterized Tic20 family protein